MLFDLGQMSFFAPFRPVDYIGVDIRPRYDAITRYHVYEQSKSISFNASICSHSGNMTRSTYPISFESQSTPSDASYSTAGPLPEYQERQRYAENVLNPSYDLSLLSRQDHLLTLCLSPDCTLLRMPPLVFFFPLDSLELLVLDLAFPSKIDRLMT